MKLNEDKIQRIYRSVVAQCKSPRNEGVAYMHGRYFNHLCELEERGLVVVLPCHVGWRVKLKESA